MSEDTWLRELAAQLPAHADIARNLATAVKSDPSLRWLEVGCSLGAGRGDQLSDVDAAIGYGGVVAPDELAMLGTDVVSSVGVAIDALVHRPDATSPEVLRFAIEYASGVQLDLVMFPATWRTGLFAGSVALVDKDGALERPAISDLAGPPDAQTAREWAMLAWWAVSDVAKFLHRESLFEAVARIDTARDHALRLYATAQGIPYPSFGLTALLDYPPFALPHRLVECYATPERRSVERAAASVVEMLDQAQAAAGATLNADIRSPWTDCAKARLKAAANDRT